MAILQGDETGFQRPQQQDGATQRRRQPEHDVDPDRRFEFDLDQCGEQYDNGAEDENDENRWSIPGILRRNVQAAFRAARHNREQPGKHLTAAAARTTATERSRD